MPIGTPSGAAPALPELLSPRDVAAYFNRSLRTIREWARRGYLKPVRVHGAVFYRRDDVEAIVSPRSEAENPGNQSRI